MPWKINWCLISPSIFSHFKIFFFLIFCLHSDKTFHIQKATMTQKKTKLCTKLSDFTKYQLYFSSHLDIDATYFFMELLHINLICNFFPIDIYNYNESTCLCNRVCVHEESLSICKYLKILLCKCYALFKPHRAVVMFASVHIQPIY